MKGPRSFASLALTLSTCERIASAVLEVLEKWTDVRGSTDELPFPSFVDSRAFLRSFVAIVHHSSFLSSVADLPAETSPRSLYKC